MIQPSTNGRSGLRPRHGVLVVGSVVVTALVAFWAFSFLVGAFFDVVKLAVVVGVAFLVVKLVFRRSKS
jgi:hypothetical protein